MELWEILLELRCLIGYKSQKVALDATDNGKEDTAYGYRTGYRTGIRNERGTQQYIGRYL